jgi:hypothetical protein
MSRARHPRFTRITHLIQEKNMTDTDTTPPVFTDAAGRPTIELLGEPAATDEAAGSCCGGGCCS